MDFHMPKIAIYNGLCLHYHCLGYLLEYCHSRNFNTTIFAYHEFFTNNNRYYDDSGIMWKRFYDLLWQDEWLLPHTFNPDQYDIIILPTDDDRTFKQEWIDKYNHKIIFMDLYELIRAKNSVYNIGTRYFVNNPRETWIYQCFCGIDKIEKINLIRKNEKKIQVLITGGLMKYVPSWKDLKRLFQNFEDIHFTIISMYDYHNHDCSNITTYKNLFDERYMDICKRSDYVFCNDVPDGKAAVCTSSVFMSFTFGSRLIIPDTWQENYKFQTAISYKNYEDTFYLPPLTVTDINRVFAEREQFIEERNVVLDNTIQNILVANNV